MDRITQSIGVMNGKPVIKGTRLTVDFIISLLADGESIESILLEYPSLEKADVLACLRYAAQLAEHTTYYDLEKSA